jgi:hypothetical protein
MEVLNTFSDASVWPEGTVTLAWTVSTTAGVVVKGSRSMRAQATSQEAESMALAESMRAARERLASREVVEAELVAHTDEKCLSEILSAEAAYEPRHVAPAQEEQRRLEDLGVTVRVEWMGRDSPEIKVVHRMSQEARRRHRH